MKWVNSQLVFESTGRSLYCHGNIIGLDDKMRTYEGYDGDLGHNHPFNPDDPYGMNEYILTPEERVELADHMIARWQAYRLRASVQTTADGSFRFRWHRGHLADSLATEREVKDRAELVQILDDVMFWMTVRDEDVDVSFYAHDDRIGRDCYMVTVQGSPAGWTDAPVGKSG